MLSHRLYYYLTGQLVHALRSCFPQGADWDFYSFSSFLLSLRRIKSSFVVLFIGNDINQPFSGTMLLFQISNYHSYRPYRAWFPFEISISLISVALLSARSDSHKVFIAVLLRLDFRWNLRRRGFLSVSSVTFTFLYEFYELLINFLFDLCLKKKK